MYAAADGLGLVPPGGLESDPGLADRLRGNVDAAIDYLQGRWSAFVNATGAIIDMQHEAAELAYGFKQAGDLQRAEQAKAVIRKLGELNVLHGQLLDRMQSVANVVGVGGMLSGYAGLGAIPAVQVTIITGLAAGVAWFFRAADLQQAKIDALREGVDPGAIAGLEAGPTPFVAEVTGLVKWAVLGLALWAGYRMLQDSGALRNIGRARKNPPLVVFDTNPPGGVIGQETLAIWYEHADDGGLYVHEFGPGVQLVAMEDGSVCLEHEELPLWDDFEVIEE